MSDVVANVMQRLEAGECLMLVEWRGCKIESLMLKDKEDPRRKVQRFIIRHGLEAGSLQIAITDWVPEGQPAPQYSDILFRKGDMLLLIVKAYTMDRGTLVCSGRLISAHQPF